MAIYQDLEGRKAGSRLPYMQAPVGQQPDKTAEQKAFGAKTIKQAGFRLAGIALEASRMKELQIERRHRKEYEKNVANQHEEIERRVHWNRSNSHIISGHINSAKKELIEFQETLHGKDATVKWHEKVKEVADKYLFRELEEVPEELEALIDVNVSPDPATATNIAKGLVEEADVLKGDQLRAFNDIYSSIIKYGQAAEPALLDREVKAAQAEKRQFLTDTLADITQTGAKESNDPSSKGKKIIEDTNALIEEIDNLYGEDPELLAINAIGVSPQISAAFYGVGDSLKLKVAGSMPSGKQWDAEDVKGISEDIVADLSTVKSQLDSIEEQYANIAERTNNPSVLESWQKQRESVELKIAENIQMGIQSISANVPPLLANSYGGELSDETFRSQKEAGAFGSFLVRDPDFQRGINTYLPKAQYSKFLSGYSKGLNNRPVNDGTVPKGTDLSQAIDPIPPEDSQRDDPTTNTNKLKPANDGEIGGDLEGEPQAEGEEYGGTEENKEPTSVFGDVKTKPDKESIVKTYGVELVKKGTKYPIKVAESRTEVAKELTTSLDGLNESTRQKVMSGNDQITAWASHPDFPFEIRSLAYVGPGHHNTNYDRQPNYIHFTDKKTGKKDKMKLSDALHWWAQPFYPWINE